MNFQQKIEDVVRRLKRGELSASDASASLFLHVEEELGPSVGAARLADLRSYIETSCHRHCGGDFDDDAMQVSIVRRVKRLASGRARYPVLEGDIVWI